MENGSQERGKILLEIITNSTLVLIEIMKKKKRKKSSAVWVKDWLKQIEGKGVCRSNIIDDRYRFHQKKLDWSLLDFPVTRRYKLCVKSYLFP